MTDDNDVEKCRQFFSRVHKPGTHAHAIQTAAAQGMRDGDIFAAMEKAEIADKATAALAKKQRTQRR